MVRKSLNEVNLDPNILPVNNDQRIKHQTALNKGLSPNRRVLLKINQKDVTSYLSNDLIPPSPRNENNLTNAGNTTAAFKEFKNSSMSKQSIDTVSQLIKNTESIKNVMTNQDV